MNWQTNQPTDGPSLLERCNDAYKGDNLPHLLSEKLSSSCEPCFGQQLESLPTISLAFPWTKASSIIATTFVESFSSSTRKKKLRKTQFQLLAETEPDKCRSDARLLCECFDWDAQRHLVKEFLSYLDSKYNLNCVIHMKTSMKMMVFSEFLITLFSFSKVEILRKPNTGKVCILKNIVLSVK